MATVDDILKGKPENTGYTVTQSQLEADEIKADADQKSREVKKEVTEPEVKTTLEPGDGSQAKKPQASSLDQRMAAWMAKNPQPVKKEIPEPAYANTSNYADLLKQYQKEEQPDPKRERRQKINEEIGAVGDALTALVNAGGTVMGGNNMVMDPDNGIDEKIRKRYEAIQEKQKGDRDKYYQLMMKAAQLEDNDNMKKYSIYQNAKQKADTDYDRALDNWRRAYDREEDNLRDADYKDELIQQKKDDAAAKAEEREERNRHNKAMEGLAGSRLNEQRRHNSAVEGLAADDKKYNKETIGGMTRKRATGKDEKESIVHEMVEAGALTEEDEILVGKTRTLAATIAKGSKTAKGREIMKRHGYE